MIIEEITSVDDPRVVPFTRLTERALASASEPLIIVESPKVIGTALSRGVVPVAVLTERKHIEGDAAEVLARCPPDLPVYVGSREVLAAVTGYTLTRGVLCAMQRPEALTPESVATSAGRVAVLDQVCDTTNVGAIFRSAAALSMDAVLLVRGTCDPYNRRSIRTSMGTVFTVPWAWIDDAVRDPHSLGMKTVAMALRHDNIDIRDKRLADERHLAIILGGEGYGLTEATINASDYVARIPMARGIDSLNVAACAAISFFALGI